MTPSAKLSSVLDTLPDELAEAIRTHAESALVTHRQKTEHALVEARSHLSPLSRLAFSMTIGKDNKAGD
ncbi:MAG: hypothetical protein RIK85_06640 [Marinobacter sp.]